MKSWRLAILVALALFLLLPTSVAAAECEFVLGFKTLRDLIGHDIVGECLENQHHGANGDGLQQTTGGLLVWRKADNSTAFTDGYRSWINGPYGLVQRLNAERFFWEPDYVPGSGIPTPKPIPESLPSLEAVAKARQMVAALPWVQDGLASPREQHIYRELRALAAASPAVLWAWLDMFGQDESALHGYNASYARLYYLIRIAKSDSWAALRILQTPFVTDRDYIYDPDVLGFMADFENVRPGGLRQVLSRPEFRGGVTDENVSEFILLAFLYVDLEVADAIAAMSWTGDGVGKPVQVDSFNHSAAAPSEFEFYTLMRLMYGLRQSREVFLKLASLPWIQDEIWRQEHSAVWDVTAIAYYDAETARQIAGMPFLESVGDYDGYFLDTIQSLFREDPGGVRWILSHPAMVGGISEDRLGEFALLRLEWKNPGRAAVLRSLPWIQDGIAGAEEYTALVIGRLAEDSSERFFQAVIQKTWFRDGLTNDERLVVLGIERIARWGGPGGQQGLGDEAAALRVLAMPFLETVERIDHSAIDALDGLQAIDTGYLNIVLSHPTLREGIKDEHVPLLLMVAEEARLFGPERMLALLEPGKVHVWERTLTLEEFDSMKLAVYSLHPAAADNLDWLEHAVRSHVEFMDLPLGTDFVPLWIHDRGSGSTIAVGSLSRPETVAHVLAYYYWVYAPRWLQGGPASFMESVSEHKRTGTPIAPYNDGYCSHTNTLLGLEQYLRRNVSGDGLCEYSLGSALFVDLYHSLGDQAFRDSFRKLYLLLEEHEGNGVCHGLEKGICYVKLAFVTDAAPQAAAIAEPIINRWYYGSESGTP